MKIETYNYKNKIKYLVDLDKEEFQKFNKYFGECEVCKTLILKQSRRCSNCCLTTFKKTKLDRNKISNFSRRQELLNYKEIEAFTNSLKNKGLKQLLK